MNERTEKLATLLRLSHDLGNPQQPLAILGEGNTSALLDAQTFLVKASGTNLANLSSQDVVECKIDSLLGMPDETGLSDAEVDNRLMESRVDSRAKKPSVESLFHAWLLALPGINYVAHTHAPSVNSVLCSPRAQEFAVKRIFPDEIVCCDVASVFVPYTDPGLRLAQEIRNQTGCSSKNMSVAAGDITGKSWYHHAWQNCRGGDGRHVDGGKKLPASGLGLLLWADQLSYLLNRWPASLHVRMRLCAGRC